MFAHDARLTGLQSQDTGISKATVPSLQLRWKLSLHDALFASPLAYGGLVIVCSNDEGIVYAINANTGNVVWQRQLGDQLRMTPSIADGMLFIGTHLFTTDGAGDYYPAPSNFYALDLSTGAIRWQISVPGTVRSPSLVANGVVYIGVAGGDPPKCIRGGVMAVSELSGATLWNWYVNQNSNNGGAVWSPISYDGSNIFVGTGNTCGSELVTANGLVSLNPATGAVNWSLTATSNSHSDDDTGGGALLTPKGLFFISKNGSFYSADAASGTLNFARQLNPSDYSGGYATPTTDGTTIVISGGSFSQAPAEASTRSYYTVRKLAPTSATSGKLFGLDYAGNVKWMIVSQNPVLNYVAINNGVAFATLDNALTAIDVSTGAKLWSFVTSSDIDAGAVVVPSGVYVGDNGGDLYAFGLPKALPTSAASKRSAPSRR